MENKNNFVDRHQWVFIIALFLIIMFGHFTVNAMPADPEVQAMVDSVKNEIEEQDILHPEIVLRQSIWESGWYRCVHCSWKFNNPFGFRHKSWVTEDNPQGYLKFDTWQESVAYYKRWQEKRYKGGDYYQFLIDVGYAADGEAYVEHLKSLSL